MSKKLSHFLEFSREEWSHYRKGMPLLLSAAEVKKLRGQIEKISIEEVEKIYLPLSRLLNMYAAATKDLYDVTGNFLGHTKPKVPYIIGIAGSVAVGKSTTSRILKALLSRWPEHRNVEIVTTDGFLYPMQVLEQKGLTERKGFPESYDLKRLIHFLSDLKAGKHALDIPVYSHRTYDILPGKTQKVDRPDIVILEGLNVLQVGPSQTAKGDQVFVSDFIDFSIFVDAEMNIVKKWFIDRFELFRKRAKDDPESFFFQFAKWNKAKATAFADKVWTDINEKNMKENIFPYRHRARCILEKDQDHSVEKVYLRKL